VLLLVEGGWNNLLGGKSRYWMQEPLLNTGNNRR